MLQGLRRGAAHLLGPQPTQLRQGWNRIHDKGHEGHEGEPWVSDLRASAIPIGEVRIGGDQVFFVFLRVLRGQ